MDKNDIQRDISTYTTQYQIQLSHLLNSVKASQSSTASSQFNPSALWTSEEKDIFFHGLCIHSRLRPDLIAQEIPTKGITEVCEFILLLDKVSKNVESDSSVYTSEAAREMSDSWVTFEENCAAGLIGNEPKWDKKASVAERKTILHSERLALRSKKCKGGREKRDRAGEKLRSKAFEDTKERYTALWRREDFLKDLNPLHLSIIDNIFRCSEQKTDGLYPATKDTTISPQNIDALFAREGLLQQATNESDTDFSFLGADLQLLGSETAISSNLQAADQGRSDESEQENIGNLSPVSRRRYKKRLYMRRKRAEAAGRTTSYEIKCLKPGRKPFKGKKQLIIGDLNVDPKNSESIATMELTQTQLENVSPESDLKTTFPKGTSQALSIPETGNFKSTVTDENVVNVGGSTRPKKVKAEMSEFTELALDASALSAEGLDLIYLSRLKELMKFSVSLNDAATEMSSHISADTIKFLSAHLKHFLTELMHRVVVLHEQDNIIKGHTAVWRRREPRVAKSCVHQALAMMNAYISKRQYFNELLSHSGEESTEDFEESEGQRMTDEEMSSLDESGSEYSDDQAGDSFFDKDNDEILSNSSLSEHADTVDPGIWHFTLKLFENDVRRTIDDRETTDDEIEMDQEVDDNDHKIDIVYERDLWYKFGRDSQGLPISDETKLTNEVFPSRKQQNKARIHKSMDYILDSD